MASTPDPDFEALRNLLDAFVERQMEAGKWLLASLLVVNAGAIVALLSNTTYGAAVLAVSGPWFIGGTVLAFIAGAGSWFVSNTYVMGLRGQLKVKFYTEEGKLPEEAFQWLDWAGGILLVGGGILSLVAFGVGAAKATGVASTVLAGTPAPAPAPAPTPPVPAISQPAPRR